MKSWAAEGQRRETSTQTEFRLLLLLVAMIWRRLCRSACKTARSSGDFLVRKAENDLPDEGTGRGNPPRQ